MVITLVVVFFMQIQIGQNTLEQHAMYWVHESTITMPLQEVADGATKVIRDAWKKVTRGIKSDFFDSLSSKNKPGSRSLDIDVERSKKYIKEQAKKAAQKLEAEFAEEDSGATESY